MASLNSRMPFPIDLPTSGRRFGPRMTRAMTSTITSSSGPTLNGIAVRVPSSGFQPRVSAQRPLSNALVTGSSAERPRGSPRDAARRRPSRSPRSAARRARASRRPSSWCAGDGRPPRAPPAAASTSSRLGAAHARDRPPAGRPRPACSRTGTVSANSSVSNTSACSRSCAAKRSACARSAPVSGPSAAAVVGQRGDLLDPQPGLEAARSPSARRRTAPRPAAAMPLMPAPVKPANGSGTGCSARRQRAAPRAARPPRRRSASRVTRVSAIGQLRQRLDVGEDRLLLARQRRVEARAPRAPAARVACRPAQRAAARAAHPGAPAAPRSATRSPRAPAASSALQQPGEHVGVGRRLLARLVDPAAAEQRPADQRPGRAEEPAP